MRRFAWLLIGLPLALAAEAPARGADKPKALGVGPAYAELAKLPVMHAGRKKPLDTVAREEVKQIFGRETIKLFDPEDKVVATWGPVATLFDWSVRPEFWDDQPIILVGHLPLKRLILDEAIQARLGAIADRPETSADDRKAAQALAADKALEPSALARFADRAKLSEGDRKAVKDLARTLGESHKWLTPRELETAKVTVEGRKIGFEDWFLDIARRKSKGEGMAAAPKLTEVEKRADEVGMRLAHYRAMRDRMGRFIEPLLVMPRPSNPAYLAFCGQAIKKAMEPGADKLT